jgi:hypothetical protein
MVRRRIGPNIFMAFADGDETGRRILTRHQTRVLREQLRLAYLLAGRNRLTRAATAAVEVGPKQARSKHVAPNDFVVLRWDSRSSAPCVPRK